MAELERMIAETQRWREIHRAAYRAGKTSRCIDAAACAIREKALVDAQRAILAASDD